MSNVISNVDTDGGESRLGFEHDVGYDMYFGEHPRPVGDTPEILAQQRGWDAAKRADADNEVKAPGYYA